MPDRSCGSRSAPVGANAPYRMTVAEPEPGRVITESDSNSSLVTTFTVTPQGAISRVRIFTSWDGAGGIGGFFERLFAPRAMQKIYLDELARLDAYALQRATARLRRLSLSLRQGRLGSAGLSGVSGGSSISLPPARSWRTVMERASMKRPTPAAACSGPSGPAGGRRPG